VEATRLFEASLELRRSLDDLEGAASCLNDLAIVALQQDEFERAGALLDESLELCRRVGSGFGLSFVLKNLSEAAMILGNFDRATSCCPKASNSPARYAVRKAWAAQ
jgi:ATP/maltotriose-dependent transcriptional regulator MalT